MHLNGPQIFDAIEVGLVILDRDLVVRGWNRWMAHHSGLAAAEIVGKNLIDQYPNLAEPKYRRFFKSVLTFGNYAYFSQKLHNYLIPMKNVSSSSGQLELMQQSCSASPLRDENGAIEALLISIQDVTEYINYEHKLIEMTKIDPLTRLYNRTHLAKRLDEELERAKRFSTPFSVVLFDVDHFKSVNDRFGHLCGDHTLKVVSKIALRTVRQLDVVARYGGEEFCCLLPGIRSENAATLAERLRTEIEEEEFFCGDATFRITISAGVAECLEDTESAESILQRADTALYRAKREGRNRVLRDASLTEGKP